MGIAFGQPVQIGYDHFEKTHLVQSHHEQQRHSALSIWPPQKPSELPSHASMLRDALCELELWGPLKRAQLLLQDSREQVIRLTVDSQRRTPLEAAEVGMPVVWAMQQVEVGDL